MIATDPTRPAHPLPASVRAKVIAIASDGLTKMPTAQVPVALRKSVSFAPAKRAKLVGSQIAAAVELDDDFRGHLATQVRALVPETVAGLESGSTPQPPSLAEAAAVAFIVRTEGWADVVESAAAQADEQRASRVTLVDTVDRLTAALAQARGDAKQARTRFRVQLDLVKADNAQLRRALGQSRGQLKEAVERADAASAAIGEQQQMATTTTRSLEAEVRRLRTRISDLETQNTSARRALRDDRNAEVMRLRLLLDTMMDAVAGLRRELALPPSDLVPADTVAAVEPELDSLVAGVGRALLDDDPVLLRHLIDLPKVHLIIDGYNVSMTAWPTAPLDQQRERLAAGVGSLVAGKGVEATIVFDGAELLHPPVMAARRMVRILFSPQGVIADDLIRDLVEAEPTGRPVVVVTTDRELATRVTKKGARAVASKALIRAMNH
ncbi:MAG: NYN domain-containing protein [Propionibacteriales bacterium]|nr:NYN domain-containing protein [Propionibacteriales bacterium]